MFVFVRGTGRCGSKTLATLLGEHPAITRVPVNQCLPEELVDFSADRLAARRPGATAEAMAAGCRAYFEAYCRSLAGEAGLYLHKSTMNVHRLGVLLDYWPDARIVYIVRHPLGVVPAYISADIVHYRGCYGYEATVANSLLRWYNDVAAYLRSPVFGHARVLQVRFEDMVEAPGPLLERVYRFLGVDDAVRPDLPGAYAYDHEFVLNGEERRWIIDSTRDVLERLGYDPDSAPPQVAPEYEDRVERHPRRRLRARPPTLDGVELLRLALREAAARGYRRVGLFGAGYLSRLICPHLPEALPAEIVCLFDENPHVIGGRVARWRIERPADAKALGVEAVVPVTLVHQASMIRRWAIVVGSRIPAVPLWDDQRAILAASGPSLR